MLTLDTRDLEAVLRAELPAAPDVRGRACDAGDSAARIQVLAPWGDQTLDIHTDKVGRGPPRISFPFLSALLFTCIGVAAKQG
jgi:hypothetical protein